MEVGLYSYGQCDPQNSTACSLTVGTPNTFIFGFGAAGGILVPPPDPTPGAVPLPGTLAMLGLGFAVLGAIQRRRS